MAGSQDSVKQDCKKKRGKMKKVIAVIWFLLLATFGGVAQEKKPEAKPQVKAEAPAHAPVLKTEVALALRSTQYEITKAVLEMKQMEARYAELQKRVTDSRAVYDKLMGTALKDSGINEKEWTLDGDTLEVKPLEKPAGAKP